MLHKVAAAGASNKILQRPRPLSSDRVWITAMVAGNGCYDFCMNKLTKHLREIAPKGGAATLKKYGPGHYRKLAKKAAAKRRK